MSDEECGGLPTAAYRWRDHVGVEQASINSPQEPMHEHNSKFGVDKLVRRSDVKALIKERLEKQEERVEYLTGLDRLDLNDAKARRQELQELFEELEGEASE